MAKKLLIWTLGLTTVGELAFGLGILVIPETLMPRFGITPTPDTLFLGFGLGWLILGITLVVGYATKLVADGKREGHVLADLLAVWWMVVGVAIYLKSGKTDNLFLDTAKGFWIFLFNRLARRAA